MASIRVSAVTGRMAQSLPGFMQSLQWLHAAFQPISKGQSCVKVEVCQPVLTIATGACIITELGNFHVDTKRLGESSE
jgi:hypothetical protein